MMAIRKGGVNAALSFYLKIVLSEYFCFILYEK